jgi:hypothetical protein
MASSAQVTVTNASATLLVAAVAHETRQVLLHVDGNTFVGGDSSVTTSNGYKIDATKSTGTSITLHGGEALYGITTSGSHTVFVLVTEI